MLVVYKTDTGMVLTVLDCNGLNADSARSGIDQMYPDIHTSWTTADMPGCSPGDTVLRESGVVSGYVTPEGRRWELPRAVVEAAISSVTTGAMRRAPFRVDAGFTSLFSELLPKAKRGWLDIGGSAYYEKLIPVGWRGPFIDAGGYANMNREFSIRLPQHGFLPLVYIYPTLHQVDKDMYRMLKVMSALKPKSSVYQTVHAATATPQPKSEGKSIFFTMMETSTLHPDFARYCNTYSDEVWTPSTANCELFKRGGIRKPIKVVPLGIDESIYSSEVRPIDLSVAKSIYGRPVSDGVCSFKFLTVIQWHLRKGYDALIQAFCKSFGSSDDVCLVITTPFPLDTVKADLEKFLPRTSDLPQVILYNDIVPILDMPGLYDACDAYIHLSRGEGFSLTQVEAAARGLPVITCMHSGMTEYAREDNSYPVYCPDTEPSLPILCIFSCYYRDQRMWKLGDEQIAQASAHMTNIVADRKTAVMKAQKFKSEVFSTYTWKAATARVAGLLENG